jgi:two-component system response regulator VicR
MFVDDEPGMRNLIERILDDSGYQYCFACDGIEALSVFDVEQPDLMILDVMLPKLDGFQVCRRLREKGVIIPVIFLTVKSDIVDKSSGFNVGGDDYLVKPFVPEELTLRIEAHLKRNERILPKNRPDFIRAREFKMDLNRHELLIRGEKVELTPKEFQILLLLASHPGEVFTKEQITKDIWGNDFIGETSSLPVFVRKIREKIEVDPAHPDYLQTVWRIGYRFCAD